jgi:hypothetical protein
LSASHLPINCNAKAATNEVKMRIDVRVIGAALLLSIAACDSLLGPKRTAHARVQVTVVDQAGQPLPGIEVSVRAGRPAISYGYGMERTDSTGTATIEVTRFGEAQSTPDTVSYLVIATRREPLPTASVRDSAMVTLWFAPRMDSAPVSDARLTLWHTGTAVAAASWLLLRD